MTELALERTFTELWRRSGDAWTVTWLGRQIRQYATDAWLLQEMIASIRPDAIVETGTLRGGSALYFADLCELLGHGHVISIDLDPQETPPHQRVTYVKGSSVDSRVVEHVKATARAIGANVFVMLDSDHSSSHVRAELDAYADLIRVGGHIHVQDAPTAHPCGWLRRVHDGA